MGVFRSQTPRALREENLPWNCSDYAGKISLYDSKKYYHHAQNDVTMIAKSAVTYDSEKCNHDSRKCNQKCQLTFCSHLTSHWKCLPKHQLTFSTEHTKISWFFKLVFQNELIFSTCFCHSPKFPLVPKGSTWYNLFACRYIMASVWYIPEAVS